MHIQLRQSGFLLRNIKIRFMGSVSYNFSLKKMRRPETKSLGIGLQYTVHGADGNISRCSAGSLVVTASRVLLDWTQPDF